MGKCLPVPADFISRVTYTEIGDYIKTVVYCKKRCYAFADLGGTRYRELYNDIEPFDFDTHGFLFDKGDLETNGGFSIGFTTRKINDVFTGQTDLLQGFVPFYRHAVMPVADVIAATDRHLSLKKAEEKTVCTGAIYFKEHYTTAAGAPVVAYLLRYDPAKVKMYTGTPGGSLVPDGSIATVMEEAETLRSTGKRVILATNADFFDMFGNCAPSGLCIKDGQIVANPDSVRPLFGRRQDGTPVIDTPAGNPALVASLVQAVSGVNILLKDGKIHDVAVAEPFGYTPHPRTIAGMTADGQVIVGVIDGRRPAHSNGATLLEAAQILKAHGAVTGINLDGGGSSTFIVEESTGELVMQNHPADLERPMEDLIRPLFNSILLVAE